MTLEELKRLVADGEGERLECKETTGQRGEACRTLCAFLNGDGGTVVFGVSRGGKLTGQLMSDETKRDLARAFCDFEPGIEIPTEYVPIDETHQAVVCRVAGGPHKPYAYDGRPYRRVQSTTTKMPQDQYAALIASRGGFQSKWELQWDENVSMDDVDLVEVTRTAKIAVAEGRLAPDVDVNDPKDLLRRFGLLKDEHPLNGAMALFGKNLTFYPQCILKMAWFKGKDKTIFLDNRMVEGNIVQLQSEAMAFCFKHLNLSGVVRGLYREEELEVPAEALREAIINALAHRLYTSGGSVSLAIYEDRVEISNPGSFSPDAASKGVFPGMASTPRNPHRQGALSAQGDRDVGTRHRADSRRLREGSSCRAEDLRRSRFRLHRFHASDRTGVAGKGWRDG
jgi:ATP-dependent DNA helicase RecG